MNYGQHTTSEEQMAQEIAERDEKDRTRAVAPLKRAADAVLLDTTYLTIEQALKAALTIVETAKLRRPHR